MMAIPVGIIKESFLSYGLSLPHRASLISGLCDHPSYDVFDSVVLSSQRRLAAEEAAHKTAIKMLFPLVFLILPAMLLIVLGPALIQILRMFNSVK
jgi:hypothetical protein